MSNPQFVYETYIRADAAKVWEALTSETFTCRYFHATHVRSTWKVGEPVVYHYADGRKAVEGQVLECDPPNRLAITWHVLYDADAAQEAPSRVVFEIEPLPGQVRFRVTHDHFPQPTVVHDRIAQGWPWILASLKSLLETGESLPAAA